MHCGLTCRQSNGYCKVRSLIHRAKCDSSVQSIVTNTNNLTTSKHVTIRCSNFWIFRETGHVYFRKRASKLGMLHWTWWLL